jgi:hypothetical protein
MTLLRITTERLVLKPHTQNSLLREDWESKKLHKPLPD